MLKRVLIGLAMLVVAVFAYVGWNSYDAGRLRRDGEVVPTDGRSVAGAAPDAAAARRTGASAKIGSVGSGSGANVEGGGNGRGSEGDGSLSAAPGAGSPGVTPPATDSIAPDPPNGMLFGGSGHFQLYRQGDLTWRLDTETGETCIIFATEEQWRKPRVFRAGCRKQ